MTSPKVAVTDWDVVALNNSDIDGVNIAEGCPAAGLNNMGRSIMAQIATYIGGGIATIVDWALGTATNKIITPSSVKAAVKPQTITDSATITVDLATGNRFLLTKAVNGSMALTNAVEGYFYHFYITQDGTGSRTLSKPTAPGGVTVKVKGGAFSLSLTAGTTDRFTLEIATPTLWLITPSKGYS